MGWFSRKKYPPLESLPAEDVWAICKGSHEGKPMMVRLNTSAEQYAGHPQLPARLGIAIPLCQPDENGFPSNAEANQLNDIEDCLFDVLGKTGRVVVIITTGGMREFVSYVGSIKMGEKVVESVRARTHTHEVQHYVKLDAKWDGYHQFA